MNPPLPDKPSLVVLPFQNMSNDPEQEYFSDGITEDLTTDLSRLRGVFVISRNSAFTYKGKAVRVEQVGRELGVRYVVEGSVQKAGVARPRHGQLIDAATGHHVWSQRYDRELADVFALQSELVDDIVTSLPRQIREAEIARARRKPPGDVNAYDAWLRGTAVVPSAHASRQREGAAMVRARLELDPAYADATAMLAQHLRDCRVLASGATTPRRSREPESSAAQALELDPENPVAAPGARPGRRSRGRRRRGAALARAASSSWTRATSRPTWPWRSISVRAGSSRESVAAVQRAHAPRPARDREHAWSLATAQLARGSATTRPGRLLEQRARGEPRRDPAAAACSSASTPSRDGWMTPARPSPRFGP